MSWRDDLILQAQMYADRASVAQRTEQRSSKPTDAGSTPAGGAIGSRLHTALLGLDGASRRMAEREAERVAAERVSQCVEMAHFFDGSWVGQCNGVLGPDGTCCYQDTHCDPDEKF